MLSFEAGSQPTQRHMYPIGIRRVTTPIYINGPATNRKREEVGVPIPE